MSSATKTTKTYTYRSGAGGNADVSIEYSADLSALSRLEVRGSKERKLKIIAYFRVDEKKSWKVIGEVCYV